MCELYTNVRAYVEHQTILDVQQDLARLPIVFDQNVQSVAVLDPTRQTCVRSERDDREALYVEMSLETICVH